MAHSYRLGGWLTIDVEGELDIATVPLLHRYLERDDLHVVFDLSRVTFADASFLSLLATTARDRKHRHGAVRVVGASPQTRQLLALTALDHEVVVVESPGQSLSQDGLLAMRRTV